MMKKVLLFILGGFVAIGANAQQKQQAVPYNDFGHSFKVNTQADDYTMIDKGRNPLSGNKTTGPGGVRWYSQWDVIDQLNNGAVENNRSLFPIWFDTTATQRFVDQQGVSFYGPVNFSSVYEYFDVVGSQLFNDIGFQGQIQVGSGNSYTVDSVYIQAAYVRMPNKPANQVDTLIFSVAPMDGSYIPRVKATTPEVAPYIPNNDTLRDFRPLNVDSVNRAAFKNTNATNNSIIWKVPLVDSMGAAPQGNQVTVNYFLREVPNGGLVLAPGERFAVTCTFKPQAGSYTPGDSANALHRFLPMCSEPNGSGTRMSYYYYDYNDRTMSGLMFSSDSSFYAPSVVIEAFNAVSFRQELINIGARVKCTDCELVSVNDVSSSIITKASAYPNPASSEVYVPFSLNTTADVTVSLTNAVGQTVATQTFNGVNEGKATFNAYNLNSGVYFYTVEANGQTNTGRVVVAH